MSDACTWRWSGWSDGLGLSALRAGRHRLRSDVLHNCVDRHHHTAHESQFHRIHYPHHPHYGESVDIIRCLRRQHDETFIVKLSGESRLAVPGWMLDPMVCDGLREADRPEIALDALLALRALLDVQPLSEQKNPSSSGSSPSIPGDCNEPPKAHSSSTTTNNVTARERCAMGATASRRARALSRTRRTTADGTGTKSGLRR